MMAVQETGVRGDQLFGDALVLWMLRSQDQRWVVTQLSQVLQSLQHIQKCNQCLCGCQFLHAAFLPPAAAFYSSAR